MKPDFQSLNLLIQGKSMGYCASILSCVLFMCIFSFLYPDWDLSKGQKKNKTDMNDILAMAKTFLNKEEFAKFLEGDFSQFEKLSERMQKSENEEKHFITKALHEAFDEIKKEEDNEKGSYEKNEL